MVVVVVVAAVVVVPMVVVVHDGCRVLGPRVVDTTGAGVVGLKSSSSVPSSNGKTFPATPTIPGSISKQYWYS